MELHDLDLACKPLFDKYFAMGQHEISDFNFTNLYMWRKPYGVKYCMIDDFLCIFAQYKDKPPFTFFPLGEGDFTPVIWKLNDYFKSMGHKLDVRSLTPWMKEQLERALPGMFEYIPAPSTYDYIYKSTDLISLEGKKYHAKRNHINKFIANNDYAYYPLTVDLVDECISAAEEWCAKRDCEGDDSLTEEKEAIVDALSHFELLGFKGGLIKVSGKVAAFTYGEKLTDNMAVIHVEKADMDIQGAYTIINQQFCEHEWKDVAFINREEDMGLEGLRKAKLSYYPVRMSEKYCARIID